MLTNYLEGKNNHIDYGEKNMMGNVEMTIGGMERNSYLTTLSMETVIGLSGMSNYLKTGKEEKWLDVFEKIDEQLKLTNKKGEHVFPPTEKIIPDKDTRKNITSWYVETSKLVDKIKKKDATKDEIQRTIEEGKDIIKAINALKMR